MNPKGFLAIKYVIQYEGLDGAEVIAKSIA